MDKRAEYLWRNPERNERKSELSNVKNFIPYLYQGQYLDVETELAYNRFRYYSPENGSYVSQDSMAYTYRYNMEDVFQKEIGIALNNSDPIEDLRRFVLDLKQKGP